MKSYWHAKAIVAALASTIVCAMAQDVQRPRLTTNQAYVEEVMRATTLAINDPMAVFDFVFGNLPERVKVYPTENYYYFTFVHNGVGYAGNIRIEPEDGGGVKVHFVYYEDMSPWRDETPSWHVFLDASKGVTVERIEPLVYRISHREKTVVFALNDLSQVVLPAAVLAPNETFIGPIFDESGIRFFLVYNAKLKVFHYLLDETVKVADEFFASGRGGRILVGKRTGFAFYRDHQRARKILIGVNRTNVMVNNYFDGPFDQLPDNFIKGEALRKAIIAVDPSQKGHIDRFGSSPDGERRFAIDPYFPYAKLAELEFFHHCANRNARSPSYYKCFVGDELLAARDGPPRSARSRPAKVRKSGLAEVPANRQ
jgi:hypothetical protein